MDEMKPLACVALDLVCVKVEKKLNCRPFLLFTRRDFVALFHCINKTFRHLIFCCPPYSSCCPRCLPWQSRSMPSRITPNRSPTYQPSTLPPQARSPPPISTCPLPTSPISEKETSSNSSAMHRMQSGGSSSL